MENIKVKICGMKLNTSAVAALSPDYLGFIFYDKSKRFYDQETIPEFPKSIKKVGVFVNATISEIIEIFKKYNLDVIQLHGDETEEFILELNINLTLMAQRDYEIWKVFKIDDEFDFSTTREFVKKVDKFLFDTKGKNHGGNGETFNWNKLNEYKYETPFILSGGIGLEEIDTIKKLIKTDSKLCGLDLNSKFELKPGHKDVVKLEEFTQKMTYD